MAQILPVPFADISAQTMLPVSHLLWSALWLGIATDAVARARAFVRAEARKKPGSDAARRAAARRGGEPAAAHEVQRRGCAAPVRGGAGLGRTRSRRCRSPSP